MTSQKEIHYAELFVTIELDNSDSFCSHMHSAYTHCILAEHSHNLAVMAVIFLTRFYYTYFTDIKMLKELNMDYKATTLV